MSTTTLKIERVRRGLRQADLSALTGIRQPKISLLEKGLPPEPKEALALSEVLRVPVEILFPNSGRGEVF